MTGRLVDDMFESFLFHWKYGLAIVDDVYVPLNAGNVTSPSPDLRTLNSTMTPADPNIPISGPEQRP